MSDLALISPARAALDQLATQSVLSLASPSSRRNYAGALKRYIASGLSLDRSGVQQYMIDLREAGAGPVTRNVALASIRCLAREAQLRGLLTELDLSSIERVKTAKVLGQKTGNWIDPAGMKSVINAAAFGANGIRNQAILALLLGCGLRRAEVCSLDWTQWCMRENRWVVADLRGKGGRLRTVPAPAWVAEFMLSWLNETSGEGRIFPVSAQAIYNLVEACSLRAGVGLLRPHDLRRSAAKSMRAGHVPIEQISLILGHANTATTERYIGARLELRPGLAATDQIRLP